MANAEIRDGDATEKHVKATGAGTSGDPFVTHHHVDSIATGATSGAAAAGPVFPPAGLYEAPGSVTEVSAGQLKRLLMTIRGVLKVAADTRTNVFSGGSLGDVGDITAFNGVALADGDLLIADASAHYVVIPMAVVGWRTVSIAMNATVNFTQNLTVSVRILPTNSVTGSVVASFTYSSGSGAAIMIGGGTDVGVGGVAGGATAATTAYYPVPVLNQGHSYIAVSMVAGSSPAPGNMQFRIVRSS